MRIALVTVASKDYFPGAKELFQSVKLHTQSTDFKTVLFTDESDTKEYFGDLFDEVRELPKSTDQIVSSATVPRFKFTLHKLYIFEFLRQSNYDRIIFFDSDLLCLSGIDYLLKPQLNAFNFLAARDFACDKYYSREISELHLDPHKIFNTGLFVINRSILDVLTYDELISTITNSAKSYDGGDQGYLNFVVQNSSLNFGRLPLRFNYPLDTNYPYVWWPPSLIHFSGEKPWSSGAQIPSWDVPIFDFGIRLIETEVTDTFP